MFNWYFSFCLFVLHLVVANSSLDNCNKKHFDKCLCGTVDYYGKQQFVLNCTDQGFKNVSILEYLPEETEVLIFVGNDLDVLPWNVFGNSNMNALLKVVDLSRNEIKSIRGKTFHHVRNVERLLLNHNSINLAASREHPRIFSNFESLEELHLTDAFDDQNPDIDFASDIRDLFRNSSLTKLRKLHLEQNEIADFHREPNVFCDLPSLMDLHLGYNNLKHINFNYECLTHLRYIDFQSNQIAEVSLNDLHLLDAFPKRNQNLTVDMSGNPLTSESIISLCQWFPVTNVTVRHKNFTDCNARNLSNSAFRRLNPVMAEGNGNSGIISLLSLALCITTFLLVYTNREAIRSYANRKTIRNFAGPIVSSLPRSIHYTTIGKTEVQEMEV